ALAERRRHLGALDRRELVRERAALEDERGALRGSGARLGDLRVASDDAVLETRVRVVDVRRLPELAVEDDRVVAGELDDGGLVVVVELAGDACGPSTTDVL